MNTNEPSSERPPQSFPEILRVEELADFLRVDRKTMYAVIAEGGVPGVHRVGRGIRISRDALLEWLSKGGVARHSANPGMSIRRRQRRDANTGEVKDGYATSRLEGEGIDAPSFKEFVKRFMDTYAKTNNKPAEVRNKEIVFRCHLLPEFGDLPLEAITPEHIEVYKAKKLKKGMARKTVNNHLSVLRRCLTIAVEWGQLDHVPVLRWLKTPSPEFDFLTFDEANRLIAAADDGWRTMLTVALRTGLRIGELMALRWTDVDLEAGRIVVRRAVSVGIIGTPKNGRIREVPLSEEALAALRGHPRIAELVFSAPNGAMLTRGAVKSPLRRAMKRAHLRSIGYHCLRHSFASHLVMRGAPIKSVQELLGHKTIDMTMRYSHLSPEAQRDVVQLLDRPSRA